MLCGFDDDLVGQATATSNRIRGLLTQIHPALERVLGPHLDHPAVLDLLRKYPSPAAMKAAGTTRRGNRLVKLAPRMGRGLAEEISQALGEQTVVVVGTSAASMVLPRLAEQLAALRRQRAEIAVEVERLVDTHPLQPVLTSMPGVGVRTTARLSSPKFPAKTSLPPAISPPTPAWHPSRVVLAPRSAVSIRLAAGTRSSSGPCSSPHSQPYETPSHAPTMIARSRKANATTKPSSPSPDTAATSSSPCFATAPCIKPNTSSPLDKPHSRPTIDQRSIGHPHAVARNPDKHRVGKSGIVRISVEIPPETL